jgi:hypothetical protein
MLSEEPDLGVFYLYADSRPLQENEGNTLVPFAIDVNENACLAAWLTVQSFRIGDRYHLIHK